MTNVKAVGHLGMTVRDLEATRRFFVDALSFTEGVEVALDTGFSSSVTGIPGAQIIAGFLEAPDGTQIELVEYRGPADRGSTNARTCDSGSMHLALYVSDVERLRNQAESAGWHALGKVTPITVGPRAGGKALYLRDENGIVLELVQKPDLADIAN